MDFLGGKWTRELHNVNTIKQRLDEHKSLQGWPLVMINSWEDIEYESFNFIDTNAKLTLILVWSKFEFCPHKSYIESEEFEERKY